MVARFDYPKKQSDLIRSLEKIKHLSWSMEFVGDGPLLENAKELVDRFDLRGRVSFSGVRNDVANRLAASDIFVLLSKWEGLPLTILEAMRSGLPVIASNVGGVSETIVEGKTGYLVKRDNSTELINALTKLLSSPELRGSMGREGKIKFQKEFTFDNMLNQTMNVYDSVAWPSLKIKP
jgi:glycosyltransferase involved in cell wall biosynthesis